MTQLPGNIKNQISQSVRQLHTSSLTLLPVQDDSSSEISIFILISLSLSLICSLSHHLLYNNDELTYYWKFLYLSTCILSHITKTRLYNFDPLNPHFYIVKLGFTRVYLIFLISAQKHRLWVLVRTTSPRQF